MLFNTPNFLLIFLPISAVVYHLSSPFLRLYVLVISSFIFYALSGLMPFIFMVLSILWAYFCALFLRNLPKPIQLPIVISFPIWVLFMFRYLGFTLNTIGIYEEMSPHFTFFLSVLLPAGISFYTFQIIGYSIDAYDGGEKAERNPVKLAAFISFFPQLIAGPILRYKQIRDQFSYVSSAKKIDIDWALAFKFLSVGLVGKVFIADIFAQSNDVYLNIANPAAADTFYLILSYSLRIYFDFWSYSIMAIGLAALYGISLPFNFREPYVSLNPKEFWRRWHMTLSYWLRDYVYIRLGGRERYYRNILIVFALVGLWHGAGWNFVVWGLYHAAFVLLYASCARYWDQAPKPVQIGTTFVIISIGWPLFFLGVPEYLAILQGLFSPEVWNVPVFGLKKWSFLGVVLAFVFFARESDWLTSNNGLYRLAGNPIIHATMLFAGILGTTWSRTFIYFRF